jgi:hypothetical protein
MRLQTFQRSVLPPIIRAMNEAACRELAEIKGSKSNKAELGRTNGKGQLQARAKPVGEKGGRHSRLVRKRSMREREDRGIGPYEGHREAAG